MEQLVCAVAEVVEGGIEMSTNIREIAVSHEWLLQLRKYLKPNERWVDDKGGLVLYTYDWESGDTEELHFRREGQ